MQIELKFNVIELIRVIKINNYAINSSNLAINAIYS